MLFSAVIYNKEVNFTLLRLANKMGYIFLITILYVYPKTRRLKINIYDSRNKFFSILGSMSVLRKLVNGNLIVKRA